MRAKSKAKAKAKAKRAPIAYNNISSTKRGRISRDEDKRIASLVDQGVQSEVIAKQLNRPLGQIEAHIRKFYGKGDNLPAKATEIAEFTRQLRGSIHWKKLQEHYSKDDLDYYESIYAGLMAQFKDDVTEVDVLQILQAIDGQMQINAHKKRVRSVNLKLIEIDREIGELQMDTEDDEAKGKILVLESERQVLINQVNQSTKVFTELSKKFDETVGRLKSTRDQRLKNNDNSHQSWPALIRTMQELKVREREGRYAAMIKYATDKKLEELQQPYRYRNGEIDQPILLPEKVLVGLPGENENNDNGNN
jgi:hypothetical protein